MDSMHNRLADLSPEKRALLARRLRAAQNGGQLAVVEPIAIIGMGCRFPGGANDPEAFWKLLAAGGDAIAEIPPDRWDVDAFYHPNADTPGKIATRWGGFLEQIDAFDAGFFGISPREALHMDPQQRLLLEVAWEALEHAGQPVDALAGSQTGVFVGVSANEYHLLQYGGGGQPDMYSGTGTALNIVAGRISFLFDFRGPSIAIDTACSSSLVAVHLAIRSLRAEECRMALAGGVNLILSPTVMSGISRMHMLASDGRCKTFDARANGFVRSEGCGVVILKRLADALADGDPILALIRGSAVNQDGRSASLTAPNGPSQQALLRQALSDAQVEPAAIGYVEAHGAGTALGDPIEVESLATVLGAPADGRPCVLGALKSNLGHTEAAAGIAGLLKAVLVLQHETIPANVHFQTLNPHITLESTRLVIPTTNLPWPTNGARRYAGVSAFGWSGTNVHLVLEEAPAPSPVADRAAAPTDTTDQPYLLPLSARSPAALTALALAYHAHLAAPTAPPLAHLAYTAACRRSHHPQRLALVADTPAALRAQLDAFLRGDSAPGLAAGGGAATDRPKLAFVIPGQGAQWLGMARPLLAQEPVFRLAIAQCAQAFQPFVAWSLLDQFQAPELPSTIDVIQPMLFAIAVGLGALWQHWGVTPAAVVGHSMGEIAAAYLAGALSLSDAARVICRRSQLLGTVSGQGAMALVELSAAEAEAALAPYADRLAVAVCNSARETVIAGDVAALAGLLGQLAARQVFCRPIKVDVASHSPQMDGLAAALAAALDGLAPHTGHTPLYSTVEPRVLDGHELDAGYWMRNLRQPVQFGRAIGQLAEDGVTVFVELSPHPLLLGAIGSGLRERGQAGVGLASLRREEDARTTLLSTLGVLYTQGYPVEWARLFPHGGQVVALPTYPWQRARYWLAPNPPLSHTPRRAGEHPLLGARISSAAQPGTHLWETSVSLATHAWLAEHQVQGRAVLPGAAYLELVLAGARALWGDGAHTLNDVRFTQLLILGPDEPQAVQLAIIADSSGAAQFEIFSRPAHEPEASWSSHAAGQICRAGTIVAAPEPLNLDALQTACAEQITDALHYERLAAQGLSYGPNFRGVADIRRRPGEALGRLVRTAAVIAEGASYLVHPALLDAGLQALNAALPQDDDTTYLPVGIAEMRVYGRPDSTAWSYARLEMANSEDVQRGDVLLLDADGQVLVEVRGMLLQRVDMPRRDPLASWLYAINWQPSAYPETVGRAENGQCVIIADTLAASRALAETLSARGQICTLVTSGPTNGVSDSYNVIAPEPPAFRAIFQALGTGGRPPCCDVVVLADSPNADSELLIATAAQHWARVVALVQALAQQGWRDAPRLWVVTRGAQAVAAADPALARASAPLWGLGRTIMYEQPELRCTLIDLPAEALPDEAAVLAAELLAQTAEDQVALRADGRFVARLQHQGDIVGERFFRLENKPAMHDPAGIAADGAYLITGGLGGIGLVVAQWLVERGARALVLLGRRPPVPATQAIVDELRARGATVRIVQADVADRDALATLLADVAQTLPPLRGIFHAAGVIDDAVLLQQTPERFVRVMAPKIAGAWHLHTLTRDLPLDHFVLFSSGAALLGSAGQANYAAANAFLDTLAHHRRAAGLPALSINWGPWAEVGLAAAQANRGERLSYRGMASMSPAQGLAALERLLAQECTQVGVLPLNFRQWRQYYARVAAAPLFSDLAAEQEQQGQEPQRSSSVRESLFAAAPSERRGLLEAFLRNLLAQTLRLDPVRIATESSFPALGFDSLMAIEFRNQLELCFGLTLPATLVWAYPTIATLAPHLAERIDVTLETMAIPPAPAPAADTQQADLARMEALSDHEAEALLLEQLASLEKRALL